MRKLLMVITPLFFLVTIYLIIDTYSLFESNHVTTGLIDIAKWQVKLNGSVIDGASSSFVINSINWGNSNYVLDGKVAPGMSGYFDIVIDPNDTDVSLRYDIVFDFSNLQPNQFVIDSITELNNNFFVKTDKDTYTGVMSLNDINNSVTNTVRVNLSWVNDEANNDADSALSSILNNTLSIPVSINIEQYMDEEIIEFVDG